MRKKTITKIQNILLGNIVTLILLAVGIYFFGLVELLEVLGIVFCLIAPGIANFLLLKGFFDFGKKMFGKISKNFWYFFVSIYVFSAIIILILPNKEMLLRYSLIINIVFLVAFVLYFSVKQIIHKRKT